MDSAPGLLHSSSNVAYTSSSELSQIESSEPSLAFNQNSVSISGVTSTSVPSGISTSSNNSIFPSRTTARMVFNISTPQLFGSIQQTPFVAKYQYSCLLMDAITNVISLILTRFEPGGEISILDAPNRFNGLHCLRSVKSLPETV